MPAKKLGYHPFPQPSANASEAYTNPEGATMGQCVYCGFCERYGCESNAKASPNVNILPVLLPDPRFELRTHAYVKKLNYDRQAKKVQSVTYVDTRSGEEYEQPAGLVILGAYVFNNTLLMLYSGIGTPYDPVTGKGTVGKNYCYQYTGSGVTVFFEDKETNPFMAAGAFGSVIGRFQQRQFRSLGTRLHRRRPYLGRAVEWPPDRDAPGAARNAALGQGLETGDREMVPPLVQCRGTACNYAYRDNYLDLDPTYKDAIGRPLLRMTFNFKDNDHKIGAFLSQKSAEIARAMNPTIMTPPRYRTGDYDARPYQSTHNTGGTIMGADPSTSVVNKYLQAWDASNLFIMGAAPSRRTRATIRQARWARSPTGRRTRSSTQYLKSPGPLMHA